MLWVDIILVVYCKVLVVASNWSYFLCVERYEVHVMFAVFITISTCWLLSVRDVSWWMSHGNTTILWPSWILFGTTRVSWPRTRKVKQGRYNQSGFTGVRDSERQWHQRGQICNLTKTQPRQHPTTQWRQKITRKLNKNQYTPWVKKRRHYTLVHIFAIYWPIFIILSLSYSVGNLQ